MDRLSTELRILASLLASPDMDAKEALQELAVHYTWLRPAASELERLSLEQWQLEHARLFGDGSGPPICPPYQSAYLSGGVYGLRIKALKSLYRRIGITPFGAPPDYLGTLLECAADLNADAEIREDLWSELWGRHLASWVPRFCRDLRIASRIILYWIMAERLAALFPDIRHARYAVA